jgi:hypothetical protein
MIQYPLNYKSFFIAAVMYINSIKINSVAAVKKLFRHLFCILVIETGRIRMKLGIKAVTILHRNMAKNEHYLDVNYKKLRNYIVLLEMPVEKKGKKGLKEQLFWINRWNFKRIKRAGWLPKDMYMDELRKKSFYFSDMKRTYVEEFKAREKAMNRYIEYLKFKLNMP